MTNGDKPGTPDSSASPPKPDLTIVREPIETFEAEIEARRRSIVTRLSALKTDVKLEAAQERDLLKARLSELAHLIKEYVVDGWGNLGAAGKSKLANWLSK